MWRLQKDKAGSGALGDIGAHVIDLAHFVTGAAADRGLGTPRDLRQPAPAARGSRPGLSGERRRPRPGEVTVDDAAAFFGRTDGGALATFEATRFATGRKNAMRLEVNGSRGSLSFDFESMNELHVYDGTVPAAEAGFRRILVTEPEHPYVGAWWPPGHGLGYEHTFVHEIADFVRDVAEGATHARRSPTAWRSSACSTRSSVGRDESRWTTVDAGCHRATDPGGIR